MDIEKKVPKRILSALITSLTAGVVPRNGAPYIAIGRNDEISALLGDLDSVSDGGSAVRFIVGKYGSGKSFLIHLIRNYAIEKGFVCADADLSPERRLHGAGGTGIATCRELIRNLSTKASPDGGGLMAVISKWFNSLSASLAEEGVTPGTPDFERKMSSRIFAVTHELENHIGGFDFASVLNTYFKAYMADDDEMKSACLRYLRCEYKTKTEARQYLRVSNIPGDDNWYDYIKLLSVFIKLTGYTGMLIFIDECVNLYKIPNRISRESNYEKLLSIFNDTLQGRAPYLGFVFGGTPQFLEDTRRGLFSYEALRSRLADGKFESAEYKNFASPVIRLRRLSDSELYALIVRVTNLFEEYYGVKLSINVENITEFLNLELSRTGADSLITPREIIRDYMSLLNVLRQNPETDVTALITHITPTAPENDPDEFDLGTIEF